MSTQTEALRQAKYIYEHRETLDKEHKIEAVQALAEWGLWSDRQIAAIVGLRPNIVHGITTKGNHTGGAFNPESIDAVLHVIALHARGEVDIFAVRRAVKEGCSLRMLARLTGRPESSLKRHNARAVALEAAA